MKKFEPLTNKQLAEILGLTIKRDENNKIAAFLCQLSAYTEDAQFNISFNAPSSTGKSFIPMEIAKLFPPEDVIELGYCSPQAFFHDASRFDKETNTLTVDLERKIIIFLDQPHNELLSRLRPLLSHDKKLITSKIADRHEKGSMKTKNVVIRGFPSVTFCTAGLKIDEQEATRLLLLSPQIDQEKIRQGILSAIEKESNAAKYRATLETDTGRTMLKARIRAIKEAGINDIQISSPDIIQERFFHDRRRLKPKYQRDIKRILSLVKTYALLNLWERDREGATITANDSDINAAFELWGSFSESQELNISPFVHGFYKDIILPLYSELADQYANTGTFGISRKEILKKFSEVNGRPFDPFALSKQILPALESAGLITQEKDQNDRRQWLVYPTAENTISEDDKNNTIDTGVNRDPNDPSIDEIAPFIK